MRTHKAFTLKCNTKIDAIDCTDKYYMQRITLHLLLATTALLCTTLHRRLWPNELPKERQQRKRIVQVVHRVDVTSVDSEKGGQSGVPLLIDTRRVDYYRPYLRTSTVTISQSKCV